MLFDFLPNGSGKFKATQVAPLRRRLASKFFPHPIQLPGCSVRLKNRENGNSILRREHPNSGRVIKKEKCAFFARPENSPDRNSVPTFL
jgi:hypothetical protein